MSVGRQRPRGRDRRSNARRAAKWISWLRTAHAPPLREARRLGDAPTQAARFLTLEQVAAELGVTHAAAYRLVRTGELPAIKLGGRGVWRVERAVVNKWRLGPVQ